MYRKPWKLALFGWRASARRQYGARRGDIRDRGPDRRRSGRHRSRSDARGVSTSPISPLTVSTSCRFRTMRSKLRSMSRATEFYLDIARRALAAGRNYGNNTAGASTNGLTLIDLTNSYASQTFTLASAARCRFRSDDKALVVTSQEFILFDPRWAQRR